MTNADFDNLLDRYIKGRVSASEREMIDTWMTVMKNVPPEKKVLTYEDESELFRLFTSETSTTMDIISFQPIAWQPRTAVSNSGIRIAIAVIVLLGVLLVAWILFR